jgi:hypothetical protein
VTAYTITITPDDDSATTTRLRLDTSGEQVILTDLHLHAGDGLSSGQLPAIDYGLLLQAIAPTTPTPLSIPAAPPAPAAEVPAPEAAPTPTAPASQAPARARTRTAVAKTASKAARGGRRSVAPAPAAQPAAGSRTRRASAANKTAPPATNNARAAKKAAPPATNNARAAKKTVKATTATTSSRESSDGGRAYRRMPEDFAAVYQQAGSAAAVAEHYQVPRHTANGWIRRLRELGTIPAVGAVGGHDVPAPSTGRVHTPPRASQPRLPQFRSYSA